MKYKELYITGESYAVCMGLGITLLWCVSLNNCLNVFAWKFLKAAEMPHEDAGGYIKLHV